MTNITGFIKSLIPSFNSSDVESDLEMSIESIKDISEIYSSIAEITKVASFKHKDSKKLIETFYKEIKDSKLVKVSRTEDLGRDTVDLFSQVKINGDWLLDKISDSLNDIVMSHALTALNANLIRATPHFFFLTRYAQDLANFLYIKEAEAADFEADTAGLLVRKQEEWITKNIKVYARLLAMYGQPHDKFVQAVDRIQNVNLPKDELDEAVSVIGSHKVDLFKDLPSGFIGSPIYSVRLAIAQWQADRHRSIKDKKKLLELRFLHLKLLHEQGKSDINTEKEINYLQKRITDYDYKLAKIEEGLD